MVKWWGRGAALLVLVGAWTLLTGSEDRDEKAVRPGAAEFTPASPVRPNRDEEGGVASGEVEPGARPSEAGVPDHASAAFTRVARTGGDDRPEHPAESPVEDDKALRELRRRMRAADALPTERQFLLNDYLRTDATMERVGSGDFAEVMDELAREAYGDFDAQALSDVYGGHVGAMLDAHGGLTLDRLVCGMRLCMGEAIVAAGEVNWQPFHLGLGDGPPIYALSDGTFTRADGMIVYQFLFTTDPESPGFVIPAP